MRASSCALAGSAVAADAFAAAAAEPAGPVYGPRTQNAHFFPMLAITMPRPYVECGARGNRTGLAHRLCAKRGSAGAHQISWLVVTVGGHGGCKAW